MPYICKIMTLNINGMTADTKYEMLTDTLRRNEIDIALLQEVTTNKLDDMPGYNTIYNIGTDRRGTAIMAKKCLEIKDVRRIPTGRGIAAQIGEIWIVNIYAPSGSARRREREHFYNVEIVTLLPQTVTEIIIAGDFNCTQEKSECTGTLNRSAALDTLVKGLGLTDAWCPTPHTAGYTHYSNNSASRIDKIYMTKKTIGQKTGIETKEMAFTDHSAVIVRIGLTHPIAIRGRGLWKMNVSLLKDKRILEVLKERWCAWCRVKQHFPTTVLWWSRYVKRRIRITLTAESAARCRDRRRLEEFYYEAISDSIRKDNLNPMTYIKLKEIKARIVRLHSEERRGKMVDTEEKDRLPHESPSIYHILRTKKRQNMRSISVIKGTQGQDHTDILSIKKTTLYFTEKYGHISIKKDQIHRLGAQIPRKLPTEANDDLEAQISMEEVREAIKKGKRRKAPGSDGIGHEFYTTNWDMIKEELVEIMRQMHNGGAITTQQKHGILVLIPKIKSPTRPENYRPLTLLNADIKILARIIAMRISKWLPEIIHRSQHCGIRGTSNLDAVAEIRDVVAYAEYTRTKMCILTLDFRAAFNNIAHDYLYQILRDHGFSERAIAQIKLLYEGATASPQINGHVSAPIPINCSIR
jgi:exonuclease III